MYEEKIWLDHVTEFENRYREQTNSDGTVTHIEVPGEVLQEGTPQSGKNFTNMEFGILEAQAMAGMMILASMHANQKLDDLAGETIPVTLTNTEQFPFNNSEQTVALGTNRNSTDYTVETEIVSVEGGCVKDIEITDKLVNGFKIKHTGSATKVALKVFVKGGFYNG